MIINQHSLDYYAKSEAGGKAYNLYKMNQLGLNLPPWVALGRSFFTACLSATTVFEEIKQCIDKHQTGELSNRKLSQTIHTLILNASIPDKYIAMINTAYASVDQKENQLISVRSSAADEDSGAHSFAGQLSSFLYVQGEDNVIQCVKACWASAYSERSISYRLEKGLSLSNIAVSVILQTMIDPDVSGVMFTEDPTGIQEGHYILSSVYGVGEGVVADIVPADMFWLSAETGLLKNEDIANKTTALRASDKIGQCKEVTVPEKLQIEPSLNNDQLLHLWDIGRKISNAYNQPQDIEWAIKNDEIYLLQTRPITTLKNMANGFPNLWDNANIVESYSGITLPLSFTFAQKNYFGVYTQFCEILNVPPKVVREMEYYLSNMLGSIDGRVYYNLYNWYKLVGVLPGFGQNKQFMETMMGVEESIPENIEQRIKPHSSWDTWLGKLRRVRTGFKFLWYHFSIQSKVDQFLEEFNENYQYYRHQDYAKMTSDQLFEQYLSVYNTFLGQWKAPIINDFLCMVHFGVLKKATEAWFAEDALNIQNDLLAGEGELESSAPTQTLITLAMEASTNTGLKELLLDNSNFELLEVLNQSVYQDFYQKIQNYIDLYGYRGVDEMKMESKDLYTDPSFLFACLKNYLKKENDDLKKYQTKDQFLRQQAENKLNNQLSGWRYHLYCWSLKHARKALKNRENTRFSRSRVYGIARKIFNCMGDQLAAQTILKNPEDIFYLTLDEIYGIHQGTLTSQNLHTIVTARQQDYASYEAEEPKARFLTRGPVYWKNDYLDTADTIQEIDENAGYDLQGIGCCPGVVKAKVRVIESPNTESLLDGEILVAKRTDPGWVPLFPSAAGILVERGSLLSHSAIVAREMSIPAIVGIKGLLNTLKDGMEITMDGKTGTVTIVDNVTLVETS